MEVDIYDWDKTCVPFDSCEHFSKYCLRHYPQTWIFIPIQIVAYIFMRLNVISYDRFKELFLSFVRVIDTEKAVNSFWKKYENLLYPWILKENRNRFSVIISATPYFLLEGITSKIKIDKLICSNQNPKDAKLIGVSCISNEKVKRFKQEIPNATVIDVYSDNLNSDRPIFELATGKKYLINKKKKVEFDFE